MKDQIFLSYSNKDILRAKIFVEAIKEQGYSVWWDRIIPPGKTFDQVILEALSAAKCVIVLWSRESVSSDWVKNEAREGTRRHILIPVLIDDVKIPFEFTHIQAAQLIDWQGALPSPEFDRLLESVEEMIGSSVVRKKDICKDPQNVLLKRLITILDDSMVYFVGNKIPEEYSSPNFKDFTIKIIEFILSYDFDENELKKFRKYLPSEIALLFLYDELGPKVLFCFEEYYKYGPKLIHYYIANEIKKGKFIFTTNRDSLIEEACIRRNINLKDRVIYDECDFKEFEKIILNSQSSKIGYLFKLNGSINIEKEEVEGDEGDKFKTLLDSLNQVGTGLNQNKKQMLVHFMKKFNFCFFGYSYFEDLIVNPVLKSTDTDKELFWFNYEEKNIEFISEDKNLTTEIESEKNKINRNSELININNILLKRKKFIKITGNWIEYINRMFPSPDTKQFVDLSRIKKNECSEMYSELRKEITDYQRCIILGSLWEKCMSSGKALKFFNDAEKLSDGKNMAKAKLNLAKVYHKHYGNSEAKSVTTNYLEAFQIFINEGCILEAAQCKIGLANFNRKQLKKNSEALKICEETKLMLERIEEKNSKYKLVFSQYLNSLGLVYLELEDDKLTDQCINLFEQSIKYKQEIKDVEGEAETENSLGLFIRNKNNTKIEILRNAIDHLEKAFEIGKAIGNYMVVAKTCRNLGLCYTDLIYVTENKENKKKHFQSAKKFYEEGLNYWYIMKGDPPIEEKLEFQYRLGELEINHGDKKEGANILETVEKEHKERENWHNRARTLDLLCEAYKSKDYIKGGGTEDVTSSTDKIISIYQDVLIDKNKIAQMKEDPRKFKNAVQIIQRTKERIEIELDSILEGLSEKCQN